MTSPPELAPTALNHAIHDTFDLLHEDVLIALFQGRPADARAHWLRLTGALAAHQAVEDAFLAAWPTDTPPRGGSAELVALEHRRILLLGDEGLKLLDALIQLAADEPDLLLRATARILDPLLKMSHLMEHHGGREDETVYPDLEARVPPEALARLSADLAAALEPFRDGAHAAAE